MESEERSTVDEAGAGAVVAVIWQRLERLEWYYIIILQSGIIE